MPSAFPGLAAAIPVLPVPAPVRPVGEDCRLAPRDCSRFCSWANAATQSCKVNAPITATLVQPIKGFIAATGPSLDFESSSDSTTLFVQGIPVPNSQQDIGSSVYQRGHSGLASENHRNTDASRGFFPISGSVRAVRLSPNGVPTKVDLHVHCITPHSRPKTEIRAPTRATPRISLRFTEGFRSFPPNRHHFSRFESLRRIL